MLLNCDVGETLMLKLKLQYFGHQMQRVNSLEKTLMPGKIEGRRRRGLCRVRRLDGTIDSMDMSLSKLREIVKDRESLVCYTSWSRKELDTTEELNWRRQWHPTPVLLPGKSHGWRSLVGCSPWGC